MQELFHMYKINFKNPKIHYHMVLGTAQMINRNSRPFILKCIEICHDFQGGGVRRWSFSWVVSNSKYLFSTLAI